MAGRVGQCLDETLRCVLPVLLANRTGQQSEDVVGVLLGPGNGGGLLPLARKKEVLRFLENIWIGFLNLVPGVVRVLLLSQNLDHVDHAGLAACPSRLPSEL